LDKERKKHARNKSRIWPTIGKAAEFVIKGMERAEEAKPISRSKYLVQMQNNNANKRGF
jgi:hypothetical protein